MATLIPTSTSLPRLVINSFNLNSFTQQQFISTEISNPNLESTLGLFSPLEWSTKEGEKKLGSAEILDNGMITRVAGIDPSELIKHNSRSKELAKEDKRFISKQRFEMEASTSQLKVNLNELPFTASQRIRVKKNGIIGNVNRSSQVIKRGYSSLVHNPSIRSDDTPPYVTESITPPEKKSFFDTIKEKVDYKGKGKQKEALPKAERTFDELNTLLRHPTLYNPILIPRNPIVLCHGLYGFDVRGPAFFRMHYWGDLLRILRGVIGAEVFVTAVPGTGAIKQRAHSLHEGLLSTPDIQGRDLNFLAHSMGGLDARFLFSNIQPTEYNPISLTTLSTPHRGSEFMSWCRANIGIGTDFDETSSMAARATHEESGIPLPFSLKNPVLSRAQVNAAKKASEARKEERRAIEEIRKNGGATVGNFKLPYSLSTSLSSYLLDLLDSPAYANLTPSFLENVFNPSTPDVPSIAYYSIAARTPKISVLHPLFLPKLVLDGAEEARQKRGIRHEQIGNDGLVSIESAKWGTFLGVLEGCDHWVLRGSAGLVEEAKTAGQASLGELEKEKLELEGGIGKVKSWQWEDVYSKIGRATSTTTKLETKPIEGKEVEKLDADAKGIASLANWITKRLPNSPSVEALPKTIILPPPNSATLVNNNENRLLYGAPMGNGADEDKFDLERMCLAIARKLHNDGF